MQAILDNSEEDTYLRISLWKLTIVPKGEDAHEIVECDLTQNIEIASVHTLVDIFDMKIVDTLGVRSAIVYDVTSDDITNGRITSRSWSFPENSAGDKNLTVEEFKHLNVPPSTNECFDALCLLKKRKKEKTSTKKTHNGYSACLRDDEWYCRELGESRMWGRSKLVFSLLFRAIS